MLDNLEAPKTVRGCLLFGRRNPDSVKEGKNEPAYYLWRAGSI
jgi:hypothetical protein